MEENLNPITREEQFLSVIAGEEGILPEPITRKEMFLATIAGETGVELPESITREEIYLNAIITGNTDNLPESTTREEQYLKAAALGDPEGLPEPITREEEYLKTIAENSKDDGNLLTQPEDAEYAGVKWTWDKKLNATGKGVYTASGGAICARAPLKESLDAGTYIWSIKEPHTYSLRITLSGDVTLRQTLVAGETSRTINVTRPGMTNFQFFTLDTRGMSIDETINGFKLVKAEE